MMGGEVQCVLDGVELTHAVHSAVEAYASHILGFASALVQHRSVTGHEEQVAREVEKVLRQLGYDEVFVDRLGNVVGRMGVGACCLLLDSHMDTVDVIDGAQWGTDPFGGEIRDGRLWGRGSVDMKGALACAVYAGAIAKQLGLLDGVTLYVVGSVMEEEYDGEALKCLIEELEMNPHAAVMCEATSLDIGRGHRGRALIEVTVQGKSAHGSQPELGINPVYGLRGVIERVAELAQRLPGGADHGSIAVTGLSCVTASTNSVPESASLLLDRRLSVGEDYDCLNQEMEHLLEGIDGSWRICDIPGTTWRGEPITLHSFLPAWEVEADCPLVQAAAGACRNVLGREVERIKLGCSTNAVATAGLLHIPTIVLGPGDLKYAHGKDEFCPVDQLLQACEIYVQLCANLGDVQTHLDRA